jgi:crotonobetainyl-CoA:carnitine CoA-transferase CaiB-like acyl-CoA transferase
MEPLPLRDIRVLDLTRVLAGPLCTMLLGDLGADVIKVERPGVGDESRGWGPPFDARGESAYYLSVNRNKLSIALDFSADEDRQFLRTLLGESDVVVDNFLPGVLTRFGLDVAQLLREHPRLVWCTISGFGASSGRPGYDFVVQAEAGWMAITGAEAGEPMKTGIALADLMAGKDAAIAVLAALVGRNAGGSSRRLTISLADSARAALVNVAQNALVSSMPARRWGNAHANLVPYQLFQAADRAIVIAVGNDEQWVHLTRAIDLPDLELDPGLATNRGRLARRAEIVASLSARLAERPAAEWLRVLDEARVPCGIVKSVLEAIRDAADASPLLGMPSAVGGRRRRPPPRLGEHGDMIRREGWSVFSRLPEGAETR